MVTPGRFRQAVLLGHPLTLCAWLMGATAKLLPKSCESVGCAAGAWARPYSRCKDALNSPPSRDDGPPQSWGELWVEAPAQSPSQSVGSAGGSAVRGGIQPSNTYGWWVHASSQLAYHPKVMTGTRNPCRVVYDAEISIWGACIQATVALPAHRFVSGTSNSQTNAR